MSLKSSAEYRILVERYCAYRERSAKEVTLKLKSLGVKPGDIPGMVESLRKEGFINESRFVTAFVRGKFRNNHWGKVKIRVELLARGIPEKAVAAALEEIDPGEYRQVIRSLLLKKSKEIKEKKKLNITSKLLNFAIGKGFEPDIVFEILNELKKEQ